MFVADYQGPHLVIGAGVGPGWFPWSPRWWRPTRAVHRWVGRHGKAAVMTVLLVATQSLRLQHTLAVAPVGGCLLPLQTLPVLPLEMWHCVLSMIEVFELGTRGGGDLRPRSALLAENAQLRQQLAAERAAVGLLGTMVTGHSAENAKLRSKTAEIARQQLQLAEAAAGGQ